ncbi:MAG: metalloregulator ArsR/SmtB family transcription factor [Bacillota bacterium]
MARKAELELTGELFRALGHPLRIKIIDFLRAGERCVCEIIPAVGAGQPVVSKHLSLLRQAGILECRKEGLRVIYRVRDPAVFEVIELSRGFIFRRLAELVTLAADFQAAQERSG